MRGVISPYENRSRTKVRAHLINTYLTNPLPQSSIPPNPPSILHSPQSSIPPLLQSLPTLYRPILSSNRPPIILYRSLIVRYYIPLPLFLIILFPPIYTPILSHISPKAHTTFNIYLIPKRVFVIKCLQLPIDKYLKVTYNKFIRTASPNNLIRGW